jgi:hypothetical protein
MPYVLLYFLTILRVVVFGNGSSRITIIFIFLNDGIFLLKSAISFFSLSLASGKSSSLRKNSPTIILSFYNIKTTKINGKY